MKRLILFLGLAFSGAGLAADYDARVLSPPGMLKLSPSSYEFDFIISVQKVQTLPTVPDVTSYLSLIGPTQFNQISEDSLLESGYQVDLNGNGQIDEVRLEEGDGLRMDLQPVQPISNGPTSEPYRADGSPKRYRFSPDSPDFMVLNRVAPNMSLALEHRAVRPEIVELPNPCLRVILYETCVGPSGPADLLNPPTFQADFPEGAPCRQTSSYNWQIPQPVMGIPGPRWLRCSTLYFPVPNQTGEHSQRLRVHCGSDSERVGIFAQVIYSPEAGKQLISPAWSGMLMLGLRPET